MRNGKIAKLPCTVRDELNLRMENGEEGPELLAWLNDIAEVKETLQKNFGDVPISKQNLHEWRQGGFREWKIQQELISHAYQISESRRDMADVVDVPLLAGDLASMLAARYAALLNTWDGEADAKFEEKLRLLRGLTHDMALIQRTLQRAIKQGTEYHQRLEDDRERTIAEAKKKTLDPIWAMLWSKTIAKLFGGGETGEKIAEFITAVENDLPLPKFDKSDQPGQTQSNPVKPEN